MIYSEAQFQQLLSIAKKAISEHLNGQKSINLPKPSDPQLGHNGAVFVTLNKSGRLRGCIGSLTPYRALYIDVANNAMASAFSDPRFPALQRHELEQELALSLSILTPSVEMRFSDESDLISQIRVGIDGLILQDGGHRGTFLPSVWEQLPTVELFWSHLKQKAGLPTDHWSETLKVSRYTTEYYQMAWDDIPEFEI